MNRPIDPARQPLLTSSEFARLRAKATGRTPATWSPRDGEAENARRRESAARAAGRQRRG